MEFQNKIIVVTGAAGFIGSNLVKALNARGERDIIAVDDLTHGDKFRNLADCDIAEYVDKDEFLIRIGNGDFDDDIAAMFADLDDQGIAARVLVNNAGIDASGTPAAQMTDDDWLKTIATDLTGPFMLCRAFATRAVRAGNGGRIVNVISIHEDTPRIGSAAYDAAKGGLRMLTRTLAL